MLMCPDCALLPDQSASKITVNRLLTLKRQAGIRAWSDSTGTSKIDLSPFPR
jgi:hypothetical protein